MVLGLAIVVHLILLLVYYLRTKVYMMCCQRQEFLPTTHHSHNSSLDHSANTISMVFGHENRVFDISSEKDRINKQQQQY